MVETFQKLLGESNGLLPLNANEPNPCTNFGLAKTTRGSMVHRAFKALKC